MAAADRASITAVPAATTAVPAADRLSSLLVDIRVNILSRLPIDDLIRTSILSPLWRRRWTSSPVLHFAGGFSRSFPEDTAYPSIVDRCLSLCSATHKLRSVSFPLFKDPAFLPTLRRWLLFAAARDIETLTLSPHSVGRSRVPIPDSLFVCSNLSTLRLNGASIPSVPSTGFPHLRTIAFTQITISDASLESLLASCRSLEHLSLSHLREITRLTVRAPALQHLMIYDCYGLRRVQIADAPELRRLMYFGDLSIVSLGPLPKLEEAALLSPVRDAFNDRLWWMSFVLCLANVRVLSINSWLFQFNCCEDVIFKNLREVHWWPVYKKEFGVPGEPWCAEKIPGYLHCALPFLRDCSSLVKLCICLEQEEEDDLFDLAAYDDSEDGSASDDELDCPPMFKCSGSLLPQLKTLRITRFSEPSSDDELDCPPMFKCSGSVLPQLKTLRITRFSGKKEEVQLVKFVVEKAAVLDSVSLDYVLEMRPMLSEILKELQSIKKASTTACISFMEFDEDKACPKHENMWYHFMVV